MAFIEQLLSVSVHSMKEVAFYFPSKSFSVHTKFHALFLLF